jgi:beta-N-acetylhexosaminidase
VRRALLTAAFLAALSLGASAAPDPASNDRAAARPASEPVLDRNLATAPQPPLTPLRGEGGLADDPTMAGMIGQMILLGFPGTRPGEDWPKLAAAMIRESRIGGVLLFAHNIVSPAQVKDLNLALRAAAGNGLVPFIAVDQEGGRIQRLPRSKGFVGMPGAAAVAAMDEATAYDRYRSSAGELAELGFNVNFGPVVDLNVNPANPAIGMLRRSYGREPGKVTAFARQFVKAHRAAGVLSTAKHFPGHGSAPVDPHFQIVDIGKVWLTEELLPFRDLIERDHVDIVMVGHLLHPRFSDAPGVPASLSASTIKELRGWLQYRGLVVTDDLQMSAIRRRFAVEEAAVMAVAAGADLLIVANQEVPDREIVERIVGAVLGAVAEGRIPPDRIRDSYGRIVETKRRLAGRRAVALD